MKKLLWSLLALVFYSQLALAQTTHTYELDWVNPNASYPVCNSTLNAWCDTNMAIYETVNGAQTVIASNLSPTAASYVFPTFPTAGTHTYSVVENYKDVTGAVQSTTPATATLTVPNVNGTPPAPITGLYGLAK